MVMEEPTGTSNMEPYRHKRARRRKKKQERTASEIPAQTESVVTEKGKCKKKKKKRRSGQVCLRPQNPPKAPENFTQFIMDYHENSHLFFDFSQNRKTDDHEKDVTKQEDDDFWVQENEAFESLYQTAREEKLMDWSREKLIESIKEMEQKEKTLRDSLHEKDPNIILHRLQEQLIQLQKENKRMKAEKKALYSSCEEGPAEPEVQVPQSDSEKENRPAASPLHS